MNTRLSYLFIILLCAIILAAVSFVLVRKPAVAPTDGRPPVPSATEVRGKVVFRSLNEQYAIVREDDHEWKVVMNPASQVVESWGTFDQTMSFEDVVPGAEVMVEGKAEGNIVFVASRVRIAKTPNMMILSPQRDITVGPQFQILGLSRTFENNVQWRVVKEDGAVVAQGFTTATGPDTGRFALFDPVVDVKDYRGNAAVEVFEYSAKDGSVINFVSVPVTIDGNYHTDTLYFSNRYKDVGAMRCEETYPVSRTTRTLQTLRALTPEEVIQGNLETMLKGVGTSEDEAGYFSSIPEGVAVEDVAFEGSTVRVQFSQALEQGVGGSCRVAAIRSQIVNTVMAAADGVKIVEIAVGERVEDVLQP